MQRWGLLIVLATMLLYSATLAGADKKYHFRLDYPAEKLNEPGFKVWGVSRSKVHGGFRIISYTKLSGSLPMKEEVNSVVASGTSDNWSWDVRAVPSLLPSWRVWEKDPKIAQRAQSPDDWSHPAATWHQAFNRAHKVATYLLGREPLALKITVLLIPEGTPYEKSFADTEGNPVHLTFAFYYPTGPDDADAIANRFSALVTVLATTMHEFEHVLSYSRMIKGVGRGKTDQAINDEARGLCWSYATTLALTSGSHTELQWPPLSQTPSTFGVSRPHKRQFSDALPWALYFESRSTSSYLAERGITDLTVRSNDPAAMNAVLSACRAMTQTPFDLTAGPYPTSEIRFMPFFPTQFENELPAR